MELEAGVRDEKEQGPRGQEGAGDKSKEEERKRGRPANAELRMRESVRAMGGRAASLESIW